MNRVRIFVCYRKMLSRQEKEKVIWQKNTEAEILHYVLHQSGQFDPWVDSAELAAGMKWETEIYRRLLGSDVLLVLVGPGTSESTWVQREIALATALGISIVPIGFDLTNEQMKREAEALSISDVQWTITRNIRLTQANALLAEIGSSLTDAANATRDRQRTTLAELWDRRTPKKPKAPDAQRAATYRLFAEEPEVRMHIASGDMMKLRNIDVFVNSENDYMQMARFFESRTISSMLRRRGARVIGGRYQDTIQQELDWQLRDRGRPVQAAEAFPTSAGGPQSELAKTNKARAIIHVAAVQAVDSESRVSPYKEPYQIEEAVRAVLSELATINSAGGIFSPPNTDQRRDQELRSDTGSAQFRSVVFPLLGTGHGGAAVTDVIGPIVDSIAAYLADIDNVSLRHALTDIYLSAFSEEDVALVRQALDARGDPIAGVT
jgi:O-acetyl-ADP-ribose deacetylase (regulator of RNase III)